MSERKKNSTTIKKDLNDFLSIIQPVAEVVEEEAEQRYTRRKPKFDPGQKLYFGFLRSNQGVQISIEIGTSA